LLRFLSRTPPKMAVQEPPYTPVATRGHKEQVASPGTKLIGREFYKSIGSPKYIVAPMVDRSEFVWLACRTQRCAILILVGMANAHSLVHERR
jgi:hypothetical protein